jgi:hypothetical protein
MTDEVIEAESICVHIPPFSSCSREALKFTAITASSLFTPIPHPWVELDALRVERSSRSKSYITDLSVGRAILSTLESTLAELEINSPLNLTSSPVPHVVNLEICPRPDRRFPPDPSLERDSEFLKLRSGLNACRNIFDGL